MNGIFVTAFLGLAVAVGALVVHCLPDHERAEEGAMAVALGAVAALMAFDLAPELLKSMETGFTVPAASAAAGFLTLVALDHFIPDHGDGAAEENKRFHIGTAASIAIIIHNVVEGLAIYAMTERDMSTGVMMAFGVGLHNIPMGMMLGATLLKKGKGRFLFLAAVCSTFAGGLVMRLSGISEELCPYAFLTSFTFGMLAFILFMELLPDVACMKRRRQAGICALIGAAAVFVGTLAG